VETFLSGLGIGFDDILRTPQTLLTNSVQGSEDQYAGMEWSRGNAISGLNHNPLTSFETESVPGKKSAGS